MMYKVKNKTYQPLPLLIGGKSVVIPERKSLMNVERITKQMSGLKKLGLIQIIKMS